MEALSSFSPAESHIHLWGWEVEILEVKSNSLVTPAAEPQCMAAAAQDAAAAHVNPRKITDDKIKFAQGSNSSFLARLFKKRVTILWELIIILVDSMNL